MALSCARAARVSLASVGGHATPAERLELESHLAVCARCSVEHAALSAVRALRAAEPEGLSASARERVRRAALAGTTRTPALARRRLWPVGLGATFALASLAVSLHRATAVERAARRAAATSPSRPRRPATDGAVSVRSARGGEVRLGDADTSLGAGDGARLAARLAQRGAA